jgi:hypothetical protein
MPPLTEDEFRLLAFLRGYADRPDQHFCPRSIGEMLDFTERQTQKAARGLAAKGLAEVFEWSPFIKDLIEHPEIAAGPHMTDIRLTSHGWNYLRAPEA